jgi:hypothetical protein
MLKNPPKSSYRKSPKAPNSKPTSKRNLDLKRKPKPSHQPWLWKGPLEDGITRSMLQKFMLCPERFRIQMQEGLKAVQEYNKEMEYGTIFHNYLETHNNKTNTLNTKLSDEYIEELIDKYAEHEEEIRFQSALAKQQAISYFKHWNTSEKKRHYIAHEKEFDIPYTTRFGSKVRLRGKIDAVFKDGKSIYIQETKTAGKYNLAFILQSLPYNLQPMLYTTALQALSIPVDGLCYNIIRRPLSDQRAIRRKAKESARDFIKRTFDTYEGSSTLYPINKHPDQWFHRLHCTISPQEILSFRQRVLDPWLHKLALWYEDLNKFSSPWDSPLHYMLPFGIYNSIANGYGGDYLELITCGSYENLYTTNNLFPELT